MTVYERILAMLQQKRTILLGRNRRNEAAIRVLDSLISAVKKQIPMKITVSAFGTSHCNNCGNQITTALGTHCQYCGQFLDRELK